MKILLLLVLVIAGCHGRRLTIDEMIVAASKVSRMNYLTDLGRTVMAELDAVYTRAQWEDLHPEERKHGSRTKRKAIRKSQYRWTDKTIPYKINPEAFSTDDLDVIHSAMNQWSTHTCIKFEEATEQKNFVYFDDASGCWSYVGMISGSQTIGLAGGCRHIGVIVHEIGHAVGFHHEQNRPDRDDYVEILEENIPPEVAYNFKKYSVEAVDTFGVPYDFNSVMHYGGRAFSQNSQLTIRTRNEADQSKIGNRVGLSFHDIQLANLMYSCSDHCDSSIQCPRNGFLAKDCTCLCPGDSAENPVQSCDAETGTAGVTKMPTDPPPITAPPCENLNENCQVWADAGHCDHQYLVLYCKKACNTCEVVTKPTEPPCVDEREHCGYWKDQGYCTGEYEGFMRDHCKKSCNYCDLVTGSSDPNGSIGISGSFWALFSALAVVIATLLPTAL